MKIQLMGVKTQKQQDVLKAWCAGPSAPKIAKEFPYIWTRNQSWKTYPPTIATTSKHILGVTKDNILGFHATAYTKSGYCNLYYVAVDRQAQGKGIGSMLIQDALARGHKLGMKRWTNKTHIGSDGERFFSGHLRIKPVGIQNDQLVYDWSIKHISNCRDIRWGAENTPEKFLDLKRIPERKVGQYRRFLTKVLMPIPSLKVEGPEEPKRFPRTESRRFLLNIRGTNGSGKSVVVRRLMKHFGWKALRDKASKIWAYRLKHKPPLYVLGRYETPCGGCDTIHVFRDVYSLLAKLSEKGSVIFEGLLPSSDVKQTLLFRGSHPGRHFLIGVLDTPVWRCINRVERRRTAKGNRKPLNPTNLISKDRGVKTSSETLKKAGFDVRVLPHKKAFKTALRWIQEMEGA